MRERESGRKARIEKEWNAGGSEKMKKRNGKTKNYTSSGGKEKEGGQEM